MPTSSAGNLRELQKADFPPTKKPPFHRSEREAIPKTDLSIHLKRFLCKSHTIQSPYRSVLRRNED